MTSHLPVIAIVGRPNVGKSTLFNRLVGKRKAIVGDRPGVTVDRLESACTLGDKQVVLVDTGGIGETPYGEMQGAIDAQVEAALDVADMVLFATDGQQGMTPVDKAIANKLRRSQLPVMLVVNKAENPDSAMEFYSLGLGEPWAVSAIHGQGVKEFAAGLSKALPELEGVASDEVEPLARIAVIGRPNVGKSTLINAWLGKERMVVSPIAGTTRDAIDTDLPFAGGVVRLVDTAGQRKHGRIADVIEFVARVKAVQAFRRADTAVMVLDGGEGIVEQDMRLMKLAHDEGCALIVAVNKVDLLSNEDWKHYADRLDFRMRGLADVPVFRVSAKNSKGVRNLLIEGIKAAERNAFQMGTGELNRWLEQAQERQYAPTSDGSVVRMKYVSQVATRPPALKIFSNRPKGIKSSYRRYLEQDFRKTFDLRGVPIRLMFAATDNPYASKKDKNKR
ncbi:MAG: ribosome biogenesis GTPase Der [Mariprofundaceae bacterium]